MHRLSKATLGTVGIGLVAVFLVAGMVGGGLLGAIHMPGQSAKGSPAGAATKSSAQVTPAARTYQTEITLGWNTSSLLGATSPVPASFQFYSNISWGSIDNTNTKAWVYLLDNFTGTPTPVYHFSLNGTIDTAKVVTNYNNGVWFANYTWTVLLDKTTLACTLASCADNALVTIEHPYIFEVFVTENGASLGGGLAAANLVTPTTAIFPGTILVATFVTTTILAPIMDTAIPVEVQFTTNTSWGWTANKTTFLSLQISNDTAPYGAPTYWNFSFDHIINVSNTIGMSVTSGFNGTVNGVQYSSATWTMFLYDNLLKCGTPAQCVTFLGTGYPVNLTIWVSENGSLAGGQDNLTSLAATESINLGTTIINAGAIGVPVPLWGYEALPYVQTGWLNVTWVNPASDQANSTFGGYVTITDLTTSKVIGYLSLNKSYTKDPAWTNPSGVSLTTVFNGTFNVGNAKLGITKISYENYSWSWTLTATAASLGANVPYNHYIDLSVFVYANGTAYGGVNQTASADVLTTTFVQYPTTASASFTSTFAPYNPLPLAVDYSVAVANAPLSAMTTTILVNVTDVSAGFILLTSTAVPVVDNQTAYTFSVDSATLLCNDAACSALPNDEFQVSVFIGVNGINGTTNGSLSSTTVAKTFFLIPTPLSAALSSPASGASISVGNVTLSVAYLGSWVAGAAINIYSGTSLVFSHSMIELTPGVPQTATWFAGQTGTYGYSIVLTTIYAPNVHYFNGTLTVISHGGTVYQNSTKWTNATIISGLSGAAAGTILLVVGLIVGMIVALVLARAVMGKPAPTTPPQPWESKPGAAAAPNTCSVCGKSFSTPEELAAHGKSEHGMQ